MLINYVILYVVRHCVVTAATSLQRYLERLFATEIWNNARYMRYNLTT
jgi:hypothetical protein